MATYSVTPTPYCTTVNVANGSTFGGANVLRFNGTAHFTQITNTSAAAVQVRLNGLSTATFWLEGDSVQIFSWNELVLTSLDFANPTSGSGTITVNIIAGLT